MPDERNHGDQTLEDRTHEPTAATAGATIAAIVATTMDTANIVPGRLLNSVTDGRFAWTFRSFR